MNIGRRESHCSSPKVFDVSATPKCGALRLRIMPLSRWHPGLPLNNWTSVSRQTAATRRGLLPTDRPDHRAKASFHVAAVAAVRVGTHRGLTRASIETRMRVAEHPAPVAPQTFARTPRRIGPSNLLNAYLADCNPVLCLVIGRHAEVRIPRRENLKWLTIMAICVNNSRRIGFG
jgi:hypothetical protein